MAAIIQGLPQKPDAQHRIAHSTAVQQIQDLEQDHGRHRQARTIVMASGLGGSIGP
jgi:hypothetical protein